MSLRDIEIQKCMASIIYLLKGTRIKQDHNIWLKYLTAVYHSSHIFTACLTLTPSQSCTYCYHNINYNNHNHFNYHNLNHNHNHKVKTEISGHSLLLSFSKMTAKCGQSKHSMKELILKNHKGYNGSENRFRAKMNKVST